MHRVARYLPRNPMESIINNANKTQRKTNEITPMTKPVEKNIKEIPYRPNPSSINPCYHNLHTCSSTGKRDPYASAPYNPSTFQIAA